MTQRQGPLGIDVVSVTVSGVRAGARRVIGPQVSITSASAALAE